MKNFNIPKGSPSKLVNAAMQKDTFTENGMVTNSTSLNACVDMYFMAGSARHWSNAEIEILFQKALSEDPLRAIKIMFWSRDIEEGAGERKFFRVCLSYLEKYYLDFLKKNIHLAPVYGRWDDIFHLEPNNFLPLVKDGLFNQDALLAKWLPRKGKTANIIRKYFNLSPKDYRKTVVSLSDTVEQLMCSNRFSEIKYQHVPSVAMNKYRKAFLKKDGSRFSEYILGVIDGDVKINSKSIYPYQIYDAFLKNDSKYNKDVERAIEAQWNSLPNYMENSTEKILPMLDTSDSMSWHGGLPAKAGWSLGLYISERNESIFKNAVLTFDTNPKMVYLKGSISEKFRLVKKLKWGGTTNIEAAFNLILSKAIENKIDEKDMPTAILILSDMQFNPSVTAYNDNSYEMIKKIYLFNGYKIPRIIYWNLRSAVNKVTASAFDDNVGLVSGYSPSILKSILSGEEILSSDKKESVKINPYELMVKNIDSERYEQVMI